MWTVIGLVAWLFWWVVKIVGWIFITALAIALLEEAPGALVAIIAIIALVHFW